MGPLLPPGTEQAHGSIQADDSEQKNWGRSSTGRFPGLDAGEGRATERGEARRLGDHGQPADPHNRRANHHGRGHDVERQVPR